VAVTTREETAMRHSVLAFTAAALLIGAASPHASAAAEVFASRLEGNVANQVIAGFAASTATWDLDRGRVAIFRSRNGGSVITVHVRGLVIPALGFNPSPDLLARVICHDATGTPSEAARTGAVPFPLSGDGALREAVSLPETCFAPIVLLTGSIDPEGQSPGKFFAVTGF
jgi:hypothetical protein